MDSPRLNCSLTVKRCFFFNRRHPEKGCTLCLWGGISNCGGLHEKTENTYIWTDCTSLSWRTWHATYPGRTARGHLAWESASYRQGQTNCGCVFLYWETLRTLQVCAGDIWKGSKELSCIWFNTCSCIRYMDWYKLLGRNSVIPSVSVLFLIQATLIAKFYPCTCSSSERVVRASFFNFL